MNYKIIDIEGIGPEFARKLEAAGVAMTNDLLVRTVDPGSRLDLSAQTGIGEAYIDRWAEMANLMRLKGIGPQYSELLVSAGVVSLEQLATRSAEDLVQALERVNTERKLATSPPTLSEVQAWFRELAKLPSPIPLS